ncbi:hypothetical protein BJF78_01535 [Pseudonocardia sp. CNS-139]|nr:hypothetical protein BJF78_01535 [Pseudonocardia sp. CNS-139]
MSWLRGAAGGAAPTLVLLPHAGGGAGSFRRWVDLLAPQVAPVRVQLPGREDRAGEPPLHRVEDIVAGLAPQLLASVRGPFALYGHSMGALVAFELARTLDAAGRAPLHLFVSGRGPAPAHPPCAHPPPARRRVRRGADGHGRPDRGVAAARGRAPLRAAGGARRPDGRRGVPAPGCAAPALPRHRVRGLGDPIVDVPEVAAWASATDGPFTAHAFPGDHYFHQDHRVAIVAVVRAALAARTAGVNAGCSRSGPVIPSAGRHPGTSVTYASGMPWPARTAPPGAGV